MSKEKPENQTSSQPELKLSSAEELKKYKDQKVKGQLIKLPDSGLVVRVARPSLTGMLKRGVIPANLVNAVLKLDESNAKPKSKNDIVEMQEVINLVVLQAITEPKVVEKEPKEDELELEHLSERDRYAVYMFVQMGLEPFRQLFEESERIIAGLNSQEIPGDATERPDGNQGQSDSVRVRPNNSNSSSKKRARK